VPLRTTAAGRPEVDVPAADLDVSCSASGPHGLVAVGRGLRIGIDLEQIVPWDDATLDEGWLTAGEAATLRSLPEHRRAQAAARCWTRKESLLKAVGIGLTMPPGMVDVGVERERVADWSLLPVEAPPGFVGSLACSVPRSGHIRVLPFAFLADDDGMTA
jgi:4'-phosphopantetheinyl transferase